MFKPYIDSSVPCACKTHNKNITHFAFFLYTGITSREINFASNLHLLALLNRGAIHKEVEEKGKNTSERHYYISSKSLTAEELLKDARLEWTVETMHWMLDVLFSEDFCRIANRNIQQTMNIAK